MQELLTTQPMRQLFDIVCCQQLAKGILSASRVTAENNGKKMQVMIPQNDSRLRPEVPQLAQYLERIRPAVNEVTRQPQFVRVLKLNFEQERFKLSPTALHIADGVNGHGG
jgi:ribosome recycling factor